jgi:hypothetical protein
MSLDTCIDWFRLSSTSCTAGVEGMHQVIRALGRPCIIFNPTPLSRVPIVRLFPSCVAKISKGIRSARPTVFIVPRFVWVSVPFQVVAMLLRVVFHVPAKIILIGIIKAIVAATNPCVLTDIVDVMSESILPQPTGHDGTKAALETRSWVSMTPINAICRHARISLTPSSSFVCVAIETV